MKKQLQNGFAHLSLLLMLVIVAVIAFVGYDVMKSNKSANSDGSAVNSTVQKGDAIKTSADLDKAATTLDSENVDSDLNPDSLNQDVSSLL